MYIIPNFRELASFETTKRLLYHLVNEGLVGAEIYTKDGLRWLYLEDPNQPGLDGSSRVKVFLCPNARVNSTDVKVVSLHYPDDLVPPVTLEHKTDTGDWESRDESNPGVLFSSVSPWFETSVGNKSLCEQIAHDLSNSAMNQEQWLTMGKGQTVNLHSSSIEWERTLLWGHHTHPLHRTCSAQDPLVPVGPADIPAMIFPLLTFLCIPRSQMCVSGPFEDLLTPLLRQLQIELPSSDHIVVPALTQQLPSIYRRFSEVFPTHQGVTAMAQASLRTISLPSYLNFQYHLKLSLACTITSALRTITPWSVLGGRSVSDLLYELLPSDLWVFKEIAAVTGSQKNFDDAKHFSCILREDLEIRARNNREALIICAGLAQGSVEDNRSYAERVFGLDTREKKGIPELCAVFKTRHSSRGYADYLLSYVSKLFSLILPPLVHHGICLEAHGQNTLIRIRRSGSDVAAADDITGFAIRDFGGVRLHVPTLREQGYGDRLGCIPPGSAILTNDERNVWSKAHHALFQNHLSQLLHALGLNTGDTSSGGWAIVRDELEHTFKSFEGEKAKKLKAFFLGSHMPFKCFIRMKLEGKYRDYVERQLPNIILS